MVHCNGCDQNIEYVQRDIRNEEDEFGDLYYFVVCPFCGHRIYIGSTK